MSLKFAIELDLNRLREQQQQATNIINNIGRQATTQATQATRQVSQQVTNTTAQMEQSFQKVGNIARRAFAGLGVATLTSQIISVHTEMDALERSFVALTKSTEKGRELTEWIRDFSVQTPLAMGALANASRTMLGFGVSIDEVTKYLKAFGDISMGDAEKLQTLALAFSQMNATGKLMGQDWLQMVNAGFNPLTEIARKTGKSVGELKENMASIPLNEVKEAFISATEAGGLFNGMLEKQAEGIMGVQAKLRGAIQNAFNKVGQENEQTIKAGFKLATELVNTTAKLSPVILDAVAAFGSYKTALLLTATAEKAVAGAKALHARQTNILRLAQMRLNEVIKKNPYALATALLTAFVFAIYKFATAKTVAQKAQEDFNDKLKEETDLIKERRQAGDTAIATIQDETKSHLEQIQALEQLQSLYPQIFKDMDLKTAKTLTQLDAQRQLNEADKESAILNARNEVTRLKQEKERIERSINNTAGRSGALLNVMDYKKIEKIDEQIKLAEAHLTKLETQAQQAEALQAEAQKKTVADEIKDYTRQIKAKEEELKALRSLTATADTQKIDALQKEIKSLKEKKALLTGEEDKEDKGGKKSTDPMERLRKEVEARRAYEDLLSQQIASNIELIQDETQKELQQIEETHRLKIQAIERQEEDLQLLRKEQGKDLTDEERGRFDILQKQEQEKLTQAISQRVEQERKANEEVLNDYLTYQMKREQILTESEQKATQIRQAAQALGVDPTPHLQALKEQTDEALQALDEHNSKKQESFKKWLDALKDLSISELKGALKVAEREFQSLKDKGIISGQDYDEAIQKVTALKEAIASSQNDIQTILKDTANSLKEVGGQFEGTIGIALQTAGTIASTTAQVIKGIELLSKASQNTIKGTAKAVETSTAILAIISAVFEIGQKVASLFNNDKQKEEKIKELQDEISSLQWELQNAQKLQNLAFERSGAVINKHAGDLTKIYQELQRANEESERYLHNHSNLFEAILTHQEVRQTKFAEVIAQSYKELDYTITKALGEDRFKNVATQIDNIAQQTTRLRQQADIERSKKKTNHQAVEQYEQQIKENALKAREVIDNATEEIMGGSSTAIANKLGDALLEAFRKGEDGAKAWAKTVNSIVSDIVKRLLISKLVEQPIGRIFDKYQKEWFGSNAEFRGIDQVTKTLPALAKELETAGGGMMEALKHLSPALEGVLKIADTTEEAKETRTAQRKGIATASQESVDELNGRATAIQSHTYTIQEQTKELRTLTNSILSQVTAIRTNTDTLHDIKRDIGGMKQTITEIQTKGVKTI